jgi:recombinational DNA repair protein (RecF pathway)
MTYKKLTGIILKKSNYGEADKIITLFTKEKGKIRVLSKSVRLLKSKLSGFLQDMSVVKIEVVGSDRRLLKLISAKPVKVFKSVNSDLNKSAAAFFAAEILLKFSADEHPNAIAFELFSDFMGLVESGSFSPVNLRLAVSSYTLKMIESFGFSYSYYLKNSNVPPVVHKKFQELESKPMSEVIQQEYKPGEVDRIFLSVKDYVEHILERSIKSHQLLTTI